MGHILAEKDSGTHNLQWFKTRGLKSMTLFTSDNIGAKYLCTRRDDLIVNRQINQ